MIYFIYKFAEICVCSVQFAASCLCLTLGCWFFRSDKLVGFFVGHGIADLVEGVLQDNVFVAPQ